MSNLYKCDYTHAYTLLTKVYEAARNYYGSNADNFFIDIAVLATIRHNRYNGLRWGIAAGGLDQVFIDHINKTDSYLSDLLRKDIVFTDNKNNEIDFNHLCATLNSYLSDSPIKNEWSGWEGDLATLTVEVVNACNDSEDFDLLVSKANEMLGSSESTFSKQDINSDIDAENIYNNIKNSNITVLEAFRQYYYEYQNMSRFNRFITGIGEDKAFFELKKGPDPLIYVALMDYGDIAKGNAPSQIQNGAVGGAFANFVFLKRDSSIT